MEAQGYCTPVIAYGHGGALETVVDGGTGVFFSEQTPESLNDAVLRSESIAYKRKEFQESIDRFTEEKFINEIQKSVDRL